MNRESLILTLIIIVAAFNIISGLTILVTFITTGGNYTHAFLIGGALAIIALLAVWLLCPRIEPLKAKK